MPVGPNTSMYTFALRTIGVRSGVRVPHAAYQRAPKDVPGR